MKKPSVQEVRQYCIERGNSIDPEAFWDFYQSKGWVVGKSPMKDWRAAVRTWERNSKQKIAAARKNNYQTAIKDQANQLNIQARPGESWDDFAQRVRALRH